MRRAKGFLALAVLILAGWAISARADEAPRGEALATYQVQMSTQALADSVGRKMAQIDTLFASVEVLLSVATDEMQVRNALIKMVEGVPFIRAIIVIDESGMLIYDSAMFPALRLDLSDREYFRRALQASRLEISVGRPIVGRSSSLLFIPAAAWVDTRHGKRVVVAVVLPDGLIEPAFRCPSCSAAIFDEDGNVLVSVPGGNQWQSEFLQNLTSANGKGPVRIMTGMIPVLADWRDVGLGRLRVVFTKFAF